LRRILVVWTALALATSARADEPLRVGIVVPHDGAVALAADGAELRAGSKAYPVATRSIAALEVQQRLESGPLVLISGNGKIRRPPIRSTAPACRSTPFRSSSAAQPTSPGLIVSSCTSTEGIHVSLWSGAEPERVRRWSAYVYLGYDTEPTCTDREIAAP
jgi:hypothetical protein